MGDFGCFIWPTSPDVFLDAFEGDRAAARRLSLVALLFVLEAFARKLPMAVFLSFFVTIRRSRLLPASSSFPFLRRVLLARPLPLFLPPPASLFTVAQYAPPAVFACPFNSTCLPLASSRALQNSI